MVYIAMQTVIKHIASNGMAESVEEVGAHGDGCHIEPNLVVNRVGKLLEENFSARFGFRRSLVRVRKPMSSRLQ